MFGLTVTVAVQAASAPFREQIVRHCRPVLRGASTFHWASEPPAQARDFQPGTPLPTAPATDRVGNRLPRMGLFFGASGLIVVVACGFAAGVSPAWACTAASGISSKAVRGRIRLFIGDLYSIDVFNGNGVTVHRPGNGSRVGLLGCVNCLWRQVTV